MRTMILSFGLGFFAACGAPDRSQDTGNAVHDTDTDTDTNGHTGNGGGSNDACVNLDGDMNPDGTARCDTRDADPVIPDPANPYVYWSKTRLPDPSFSFFDAHGLTTDEDFCSTEVGAQEYKGEADWPEGLQTDYVRFVIPDYADERVFGNAHEITKTASGEVVCDLSQTGYDVWGYLDDLVGIDPAVCTNSQDEFRAGVFLKRYGTGFYPVDCALVDSADNPWTGSGAEADTDTDGGGDDTGDSAPPLTTYFRDADGDGYGDAGSTKSSVACPSGYVTNSTDCDDSDSSVHPGGTEVANDGIDQDCNGSDLVTGDGRTSVAVDVTVDSSASAVDWSFSLMNDTTYDMGTWFTTASASQSAGDNTASLTNSMMSGDWLLLNGTFGGTWLVECIGDVVDDGVCDNPLTVHFTSVLIGGVSRSIGSSSSSDCFPVAHTSDNGGDLWCQY